ncbi:MAG: type IV pili methyl-accepting chemotaxis transducer N-terminal domain-containing protein [Sulfuritalea sp.]|nr:type IV pili methyl-accepting chemotaxis transducer N-terminal domain-containing protein [Sulfuritalea sp.]
MQATFTRNIKKALGELSLFVDLAPEQLGELVAATRCIACEKDQPIYRAGDSVNEMYVLLSGQVTLSLSSNRGNEKVIEVLGAGQSFGEAELFASDPCLVAAVATKPSQLLGIRREGLCQVMAADPRLALRLMGVLARRQVDMETELAARHFCSGSRRLLDFILQLAGPNRDLVGETTVTLAVSKKVLASRFDMQPETLSRTLRDLADSGLIVVDGSRIRLRNSAVARYLDDEVLPQPVNFPNLRRLPRLAGNGCARAASTLAARSQARDSRSYCDSINQAGRLRMLSQRMAKSWLMLETGLLARQSRLILRQSMDAFGGQLLALEARANGAESAAAMAELARLWPRYQALLDADPSRQAARDLFGINEDVLQAAQCLTLSFEQADGTRKGQLINLAGRERMLSQRVAKFFMFRHMGIKSAQCRVELDDASQEFSAALVELTSVAQDSSPVILGELESVAEHWNTMQSTLVLRNGNDFAPTARKLFTTSENLLRRMEAAVDLYARLPPG